MRHWGFFALGILAMIVLLSAGSAFSQPRAYAHASLVDLAPEMVGLKGSVGFVIPSSDSSDGNPCGLQAYGAGGGVPFRPQPTVSTDKSANGWSLSASDAPSIKLAWNQSANVGNVAATTFADTSVMGMSAGGKRVLIQIGTSPFLPCPVRLAVAQQSALGLAYPVRWVLNTMPGGNYAGIGCGYLRIAGGQGSYTETFLLSQALPLYTNPDKLRCPFTGTSSPQDSIPPPWQNCKEVNARWPHGVGRTGAHDKSKTAPVTNFTRNSSAYATAMKLNKRLDPDHDGVACERK